jgi:hypothetical protein
MTLMEFRRLLQSRKVTHLAYPRCEPNSLSQYYRLAPVICKRSIKVGSIKHKSVVRISLKTQEMILKSLLKLKKPIKPYILGVSSEPSDVHALEVAGTIVYALLQRNPRLVWSWHNTSVYPDSLGAEEWKKDVVVLHNIYPGQTEGRTQATRDLLEGYSRSLRLVVVGGTNALDYFDNHLHYSISGLLHIHSKERDYRPVVLAKKSGDTGTKIQLQPSSVFNEDYADFIRQFGKMIGGRKED